MEIPKKNRECIFFIIYNVKKKRVTVELKFSFILLKKKRQEKIFKLTIENLLDIVSAVLLMNL